MRHLGFWLVLRLVALVGIFSAARPAAAQDAGAPPLYKPLRYNEDYRYLLDPSRRTDVWDRFKYIRLGDGPEAYLSFGGEARGRFVDYRLADLRIDELLALATELLDGPARGVDACKSYRASP